MRDTIWPHAPAICLTEGDCVRRGATLHKLDRTPRVIAVTAARDMATVDKACACGAFDYVVKPFTRATVTSKLADYTTYRRSAMAAVTSADQTIVDRILKILHRSYPPPPKLLRETLESIITVLRTAEEPLRAEQIARQAGVKRETPEQYEMIRWVAAGVMTVTALSASTVICGTLISPSLLRIFG
jgi:response regulator of citrate/malate metabolism